MGLKLHWLMLMTGQHSSAGIEDLWWVNLPKFGIEAHLEPALSSD